MSDLERLALLTSQMHLEPAEDLCQPVLPTRARRSLAVTTASLPGGGSIRLLKTLLSSYCKHNCNYCPFRSGRDIPRADFSPDEFARLFDSLTRSGFVEGIFLSSSVFRDSITTQDKLLATASLLRGRYNFRGYLHLKIMPGAERSQVREAMLLADRLSINLEAPHSRALSLLAPQKEFRGDLLAPLQWIDEIRSSEDPHDAWNHTWPSSTTQFVVGAAGETDRDILSTTSFLQHSTRIARVYYSSFTPIPDTPLEALPATPPLREQRLYQAFYLLRDYGYNKEELVYNQTGNLLHTTDPKLAWARKNLLHHPLEINTAPRSLLLRVPSLGPERVEKILSLRKQHKITSLESLKKYRLAENKASPYLLFNGKITPHQPPLL